ncbi:MAG: hypothetical protein PUB42_05490 [Firmicutes bacterium]|nr:hypothetical protein [Bacillota bacterium]
MYEIKVLFSSEKGQIYDAITEMDNVHDLKFNICDFIPLSTDFQLKNRKYLIYPESSLIRLRFFIIKKILVLTDIFY